MTPDLLICGASISAERLSLWRDGGLPAAEAQHLREHSADCPACRERLAGFERVAEALRGQRELEPNGRIWPGVRQGAGRPPRRRPLALSGRALRGLAGLAAVLALATLFANLLGSHTGNRPPVVGRATTSASASTPGPTATPAAFPGGMEIVDGVAAQRLSYAYVLDNDVWIGWRGKVPFQATHLALGTGHLIWTVAWSQDQTLLLVNETADVDAKSARAWLIQLVPDFSVSEVAAGSPLVRGCANYFTCLWVGHRFIVHVDRAIHVNQYHAYRMYDMKAGADVP
ncbi:MAG TPA: zf-HC2 domain-containing protein, partial [Ktedonobacterales bacterium]